MSVNTNNNKLVIITPFYNPGEFLEKCVSSIITQKYDNYKVIFIDDMSTDGSWDKLPHDNENVVCIKNTVRKTALENIHNAIIEYCEPEDICVLVDGDDWLYNKKVLYKINKFYEENSCFMMYGQCTFSNSGQKGNSKEYTIDELKNIRNLEGFHISHIRTFKAFLYKEIGNQDVDYSCLKDDFGNFYKMTYDVAMFYPIIEICNKEKVKYNDEILYVYNTENPISDFRVNSELQLNIHKKIRNKKKFKEYEGK